MPPTGLAEHSLASPTPHTGSSSEQHGISLHHFETSHVTAPLDNFNVSAQGPLTLVSSCQQSPKSKYLFRDILLPSPIRNCFLDSTNNFRMTNFLHLEVLLRNRSLRWSLTDASLIRSSPYTAMHEWGEELIWKWGAGFMTGNPQCLMD
jgi:hypothetical protein